MKDVKDLIKACTDTIRLNSFTRAYNDTFELVRCDTEELKRKAYGLRHRVYWEEYGYELPAGEGSYVEKDEYDDHAVHFILRHRASNEVAGTLRLILPDDDKPLESFPVQKLTDYAPLRSGTRALTVCEISRFCMAPRFRKRLDDGRFLSSFQKQDIKLELSNGNLQLIRRRIGYAPAALLAGAFEAALQARITDCVWMVELSHLWSLNQIGVPYRILGNSVDIHGGLTPVIFNIKHTLDNIREEQPACWEIVSAGGRLQDLADELVQNDWADSFLGDDDY